MTKLLIATRPDDTHAIYVKLALNKIGHAADLWYTADFPSKASYSFSVDNNRFTYETGYQDYDVIWYRRPAKPQLPNRLHPDDLNNAQKENNMFIHSMWQVIFPHAKWINPVNSSYIANSKLLQLKLADQIGMNIPTTLVSNNPNAIKKFISSHDAIYKTLYPMAWINDNDVKLTYADTILVKDLPNDALLQCTPGIFQKKIEKKYELRITYFGNKYIAVKINSQQHEKAKSDWRYAPTKELQLEQIALPSFIDEYCQKLMHALGIVFGCFDFIVTPDDEYYFLEVNEQGQFLWVEDVNPNIKMLQAFCDFILDSDKNSYKNQTTSLSVSNFETNVEHYMNNAMKNHINPPLYS